MPGRRSTIRYWPVSSLTTERIRSMSTGLAASTVTPGSTPPDASRTTPVMAACAYAAAGKSTTTSRTKRHRLKNLRIASPQPGDLCKQVSGTCQGDKGLHRHSRGFFRRLQEVGEKKWKG